MLFLSETKVESEIVEKCISRLKAKYLFIFPSIGRSRGFAIAWFQGISSNLISFQHNVFNFQIIKDNLNINVSFIYGALDNNLRTFQWDFPTSFSDIKQTLGHHRRHELYTK